jgi:hypothetical protein
VERAFGIDQDLLIPKVDAEKQKRLAAEKPEAIFVGAD